MPVKMRRAKARLPRLDDLSAWEAAFIEERMTEELSRTGGYCHFAARYGPPAWCRPSLIARCLALWQARNDRRRRREMPPIWPDDTTGLRTLDPEIPLRHPRPQTLESEGV